MMSDLLKFEDLRFICRVCLNKNKVLILLSNYLYGVESSHSNTTERPLIINVLSEILSEEIGNSHPKVICPKCLDQVKSAYSLKLQLQKSQEILRKCEESIIASYIKDDHFEVIDSDLNHDSQDYFESISATDNIPKIFMENSSTQDSDQSSSEPTDDMKEIIDSSNIENIKSEPMLIKNLEEVSAKKQTNIIKVQTNNKYRDDIQVRCIDSNKFIIERKPVDNDKGLENPRDLPLDMTATDEHLQEKSSLGTTKLEQMKCLSCGGVYSKGKFKSHVTNCKNLKTVFTCKECRKVFKKVKDLNFHVKLRHSQDPFPCKICGVLCINYNARQLHMRKNHSNGKSFICEICNKGFYYNAGLLKHKSKHTKETQEVCNICGKSFHYQGALFYHIKMHTNERKYLCNFCERKFYTSQSLQRHLDTHTGERRYKCQFCEKSFRSSSERRRHEMIHTGEKPFQCDYCDKGFISKYNLDVHTASHRGQQPCVMCTGKYLNAEVLQLHLKLKHKVKLEDIQSLE